MATDPLKNWIPYKTTSIDGRQQCCWLNTLGMPFTEPFFVETVSRLLWLNSDHDYRAVSDLRIIKEWAEPMDDVKPAFIFHISRCGSTLVSQQLASAVKNIVLSEVPFFDEVLRLPLQDRNISKELAGELFTAAVKFYSQQTTGYDGGEQPVFIKADSWHLFFYEQLRSLYPSAPFIAIYRRPDDVFRSQKKQPGMHTIPGLIEPELFGFEPGSAVFDNADTYLATVLESYFNKCLEIAETDNNFLLLNYDEGAMPVIKKIAAFTNLQLTPQNLEQMEDRSRYHSKKPGERFNEEAETGFPPCLEKAMALYHLTNEKRMAINS